MPNSAEAGMNQVRARAKYLYKDRQEQGPKGGLESDYLY